MAVDTCKEELRRLLEHEEALQSLCRSVGLDPCTATVFQLAGDPVAQLR